MELINSPVHEVQQAGCPLIPPAKSGKQLGQEPHLVALPKVIMLPFGQWKIVRNTMGVVIEEVIFIVLLVPHAWESQNRQPMASVGTDDVELVT